jgi:hypothetical protein
VRPNKVGRWLTEQLPVLSAIPQRLEGRETIDLGGDVDVRDGAPIRTMPPGDRKDSGRGATPTKSTSARSTRRTFSSSGAIRASTSSVARGCPWNATA